MVDVPDAGATATSVTAPLVVVAASAPVDAVPLPVVELFEVLLLGTVHHGGQVTGVTGTAPA